MFVLEFGTKTIAIAVSESIDALKQEAVRDAGQEVDWVASSATCWHGSFRKPEGLVHYTIRSIRKVGK